MKCYHVIDFEMKRQFLGYFNYKITEAAIISVNSQVMARIRPTFEYLIQATTGHS